MKIVYSCSIIQLRIINFLLTITEPVKRVDNLVLAVLMRGERVDVDLASETNYVPVIPTSTL